MQPELNPLHAVYASTVGKKGVPPKSDFVFDFRFPAANFSRLEGLEFETEVVWKEADKSLFVSTALAGITFKPWEGINQFLSALNVEMRPFLRTLAGGGLRAVELTDDSSQLAPMYEFRIVCNKMSTEQLQDVFDQLLFDRAAFALWLSRTIFAYIAAVKEEPDALERMKMLCREHGRFAINLMKEVDHPSMPRGLYESLYKRGLDRLQ